MLINDQEKFTVPVGLVYNFGAPPVVQRYLPQGMSAGAVRA